MMDDDGWTNKRGSGPSVWEQKRTWTLKKCKLTGEFIFPGSIAWCKTYYHYYSGVPAFSDWASNSAYTFQMLKDSSRLKGDL